MSGNTVLYTSSILRTLLPDLIFKMLPSRLIQLLALTAYSGYDKEDMNYICATSVLQEAVRWEGVNEAEIWLHLLCFTRT